MIPKYSVKRPFTVAVAVVMVFILGIVSFFDMKTDLLPSIDLPYAMVLTQYPGASPEKVEMSVTKPIEQVVSTVSGVKNVSSTSSENASMVMIEFDQNVNMDSAILDVNSQLDLIKSSFEDGVSGSSVMKLNPDSMPVMILSVDVKNMDIKELSNYVSENVVPKLERTNGVGSVSVTGLLEEKIQINLDNDKISSVNKKVKSKIDNEMAEQEKKLKDSQNQIANGKSQLEEQSKIQKENLVNAEVELQSAKIKLELLASQLASQGMNKETLNKTIEETSKSLKDAESKLNDLQNELNNPSQNNEEYIMQIQARITVLNTTIENLKKGIDTAKKGLETLNSLDNIKEQEKQLKIAQNKVSEELSKASLELSQGESELKKASEQLKAAKEQAYEASDMTNKITPEMISNIVMAQNFAMPAGYVSDDDSKHLVKVGDKLSSIEELENLLLFDINGVGKIYLKDVAYISKVDNSKETYANINGNDGVMISLQKSSVSSTTEVTKNIGKTIDDIMKENDKVNITTLMDQGIYIEMIIDSVLDNLIFGGALAIIVLLLFLKSFKPTIIIALSIPISLFVSMVLMYFSNITLNIISLSGLSLGVGMLVDNSIVVIENISKMREKGMSAAKASVYGAKQVSGAIFASTLTTICVFLPIVFADGMTKQIFTDMGLTIGYSLLSSLIVSLTVVPAMSSKLLEKVEKKPSILFDRLINLYEKALRWALKHKAAVILPVVALLIFSVYKVGSMGTSFMPSMDSTEMSATLEMPIGSSKKDTIKMSDKIINNLMKIDDIETIGATDSTNSMLGKASDTTMSFFIKLKEDKKHSNTEIAKIIEERTKDFDCELKVSASNMDMGALAGSGIQVIIKGEDLDELKSIAKDISKEIKPIKGIKEITTGLENPSKETRIIVDKNKAMEYGLTTAQIYQTIANEIKTDTSSTILTIGRNDYPVIVSNGDSLTKNELKNLTITGTKDNEKVDVKISNIASISDDESLSSISRENQSRYMTVTATIDTDYNVGLVGKDVKAKLDNYKVKDGYSIEIGGEMETISDAMGDLVLMITLAVVFVYLVMVAQFQSLLSPFIVMFTIPLAFTGGLLALLITGNDLSVVSMLGFLVLSGVVVNNGIVFVDYVNQLRATGMSKKEAIIETGRSRIRPILMTALTTILAMSTMALSNSMGAEMTQGLAIVSIGGLAYSTILTLVIIPILYDLMQRNEFRVIDIED